MCLKIRERVYTNLLTLPHQRLHGIGHEPKAPGKLARIRHLRRRHGLASISFTAHVTAAYASGNRDNAFSTTPNNTISGYLPTDVNLDGAVKYTGSRNDRDPILITIGGTVPNAVRTQTLP